MDGQPAEVRRDVVIIRYATRAKNHKMHSTHNYLKLLLFFWVTLTYYESTQLSLLGRVPRPAKSSIA